MKTLGGKARCLALFFSLMLCLAPGLHAAERELHWDALDVEAHLDADGVLDIIERHTIDASTGSLQPLRETSVPNDVDEFTWTDRRTLRWRSRLPSDPPFANTQRTYVLHYKLSGILVRNGEQYRIEHDFAFPNRSGPIQRFTLNLDLDQAWQPLAEYQSRYSAGPLEPGEGFVVNIPLRYSRSVAPTAIDTGRPPEIVVAVLAVLGMFALLVFLFLKRERSLGRFAPIDPIGIDSAWIENNILGYPAEVVGAAWDGRIGTSEVVALIARMTAEGKLESKAVDATSMSLRLKVERDKLTGHERALVDGLFFDHRTETSTKEVRQHYKSSGFDPATVIKPELANHVKKVLPPGDTRVKHRTSVALYVAGLVLLAWSSYSEPLVGGGAVAVAMISLLLIALLQLPGWLFRTRIDWGLQAAALLLIPASLVILSTASFLWWGTGAVEVDLPGTMIAGLTVLALAISNASINGMKSRQSGEAIAFRKRLARGRSFFLKELEKSHPELRDRWYPWLLAFGLGRQVDVWSSHHTNTTTNASTWDHSTGRSSSSSSSTNTGTGTGWSGGGGLSGGAGASGAWAAAAAGMAAGVAAPSSSSSSGSSSSSSGGSSGGGGGGGW